MIKLSKRMKAVSSMVTPGSILADIGTDHGYVPISLVQRKKIKKAIAMDVNKGPLKRAEEHIREAQLEEYIETRLSDGVKKLEVGEVNSILIAGMGGDLVIRIIKNGMEVCRSVDELILQPQSELGKVRKFLRENNFEIIDEDMVIEDGKYYPMMKVTPVDEIALWEILPKEVIPACDMYGPYLLKNGNPSLRKYLVKQHKQLTKILKELEKQPESKAISKRIKEVQKEITLNESAYT
ncbi:MAG: SAM-dependent methyltransferase, partial [Agathobacter sp.]|nr:SAM-dependent methyltransferase [Agathobacter sp.]